MKRGSSGDAFLKLLERARRAIPSVALRTSFIVGFPGETEADFRELCDFVRAAQFDWLGVFAYSDEENAESFALDGKVEEATIARRRDELMSIQRKISARKLRKLVGKQFTAMLEGPSPESELVWQARLATMAPEIDGKVYITDLVGQTSGSVPISPSQSERTGPEACPTPGQLATVEITEAHDYDLVARVVELRSEAKPDRVIGSSGDRKIADAPMPVVRIATGAPLRVLP
jgi:ribosomal protein S12 methylthiotransferase